MITRYQNLISKTKNLLLKEIIDQNWKVVTQNQNLIKKVITQNQNLIKVEKLRNLTEGPFSTRNYRDPRN